VHVHDAGRDGFNRTKKLRWQASQTKTPTARTPKKIISGGARRMEILASRFSRDHAMTKSSPGVSRKNCAVH